MPFSLERRIKFFAIVWKNYICYHMGVLSFIFNYLAILKTPRISFKVTAYLLLYLS